MKRGKYVVIFESVFESVRLGKCLILIEMYNICNYHDHHDHDGTLHKAARKVNFVQPNIGLNYSKFILVPMVILKLLVTFDFNSSKLGCTLITCKLESLPVLPLFVMF